MSSIFYNNLDSNDAFGLKIENIPQMPATNAKYQTEDIPGGENGSLNIFDGYSDNVIPFNFVFKATEDFEIKKAKIINWLNSKVNSELTYSLSKGMFYIVKKVEISSFKTTSRIVRRFTATFTLEPLTYLLEGKETLTVNAPATLFNDKSTHDSPLYMKVYGTGDITININNQSLILKNIVDFIEVDSKIQNCFKTINGVIQNCNNQMYTPFPKLEVGENNISWSGSVSKIEIIPRWCC